MTLRERLAETLQEIRGDFHKGRRYRNTSAQRIRAQASVAIEALLEQLDVEQRDEEDRSKTCPIHKAPYLAGVCVGCKWHLAPTEEAGSCLVDRGTLVHGSDRS